MIFDLRRDLYRTLQRLPLRWYDSRATGDIITRVIDDVTAMERVLIDGVEQALISVLSIVGAGVLIFQMNPWAGGVDAAADAGAFRGRDLVHADGGRPGTARNGARLRR